ncbi:MAG: glycosyltransferase [Syntrophobacteraceae bacterium]
MLEQDSRRFIFLDLAGRRWPRLRLLLVMVTLLAFCGGVWFIQSLFVSPQLRLSSSISQLQTRLHELQKKDADAEEPPLHPRPLWREYSRNVNSEPKPTRDPQRFTGSVAAQRHGQGVVAGFYVAWDEHSYDSLRANGAQLTHVVSQWLSVVDGSGALVSRPDLRVRDYALSKGIVFLPVLDNLIEDAWQPEAVEGLANGPIARQDRFVGQLVAKLKEARAGGLAIDWGILDPTYVDAVTALIQRIADAVHHESMELWLYVPVGLELKSFDLEALAPCVDRFVATLHDETSENDSPGPIASQPWFEGWLETLLEYVDPEQWIVEIGSYGYDWTKGARRAETIRFHDVMSRGDEVGLTQCKSEAPLYNPQFSYEDGGTEHKVWFLDASTFVNQLMTARKQKVAGISISQLGYEDPGIWPMLKQLTASLDVGAGDLTQLRTLRSVGAITHVGRGEFVTVDDEMSDGSRVVSLDDTGRVAVTYEAFPSYLTLYHEGADYPDTVAISFDDGPDPKWTPKILDGLRAKGTKASFFLVGSRMEANPGLVQRILKEGHEIGVHSYTHPNMAAISEERARLELNATQRLIETLADRSTILFRPPYSADSRPHDPAEVIPIKLAQDLGYLTVTEDIDPEDWAKPGVEAIVQRVKQGRKAGGTIVLLHDAGGDRRQTVEALPRIIDYLHERGDRIVTLSEMIGKGPDELMPAVKSSQESFARLVSQGGFRVLYNFEALLWSFMIAATILVILRTLIITLLASRHTLRRRAIPLQGDFQPPVSVILAAFNEEKVIEETLKHLLRTTYPGTIEVLVVDDGSKDRTAEIVERVAETDPRVRLIRQPNQGKALALRAAIAEASYDIVVMLDADTQFAPQTIGALAQPLADSRVGAVSGHAKVGNLRTFIARCQALEYICGFNLDRRAYHQLNCITVVPGAVSALRKSAVMQVGGISTDTLAEDTDLTLALHRKGYRVAYVPAAIAWTEAPESVRALVGQRFRWAFGTLQCLWKHRDMVFNPHFGALGWFSLPSVWFFQILLVTVTPLVDFLLVCSLFLGVGDAIYTYFMTFLIMDIFLAGLACRMEGERLSKALLIIPMRFIYRPLLSLVIWKSIIKAAKGAWVTWGKLDRTASVPSRA